MQWQAHRGQPAPILYAVTDAAQPYARALPLRYG
jgi:hypothetical protein